MVGIAADAGREQAALLVRHRPVVIAAAGHEGTALDDQAAARERAAVRQAAPADEVEQAYDITLVAPKEWAIVTLFYANLLMNFMWMSVCFTRRRFVLAACMLAHILTSGVIVLVLLADAELWVQMGLYAPYPAWCLFALYLNCRIAHLYRRRKNVKAVPMAVFEEPEAVAIAAALTVEGRSFLAKAV